MFKKITLLTLSILIFIFITSTQAATEVAKSSEVPMIETESRLDFGISSEIENIPQVSKLFAGDFRALGIGMMLIIIGVILTLIIVPIWLFCRIFKKAGYPAVLGILMVFPVINLILLMILAFLDWPIYRKFESFVEKEEEEEASTLVSDEFGLNQAKIKFEEPLKKKKKKTEEKSKGEPILPLPTEKDSKIELQKDRKKEKLFPEVKESEKPESAKNTSEESRAEGETLLQSEDKNQVKEKNRQKKESQNKHNNLQPQIKLDPGSFNFTYDREKKEEDKNRDILS